LRNSFALILAVTLASCASGGGTVVSPESGAFVPSAAAAPRQVASQAKSSFEYGQVALDGATYSGPALHGTMSVDVSLKLQNVKGLQAYAAQVGDPKSPEYRHFLTPQQIGDKYGASPASIQAVARYFASYHLHVGSWPQRLSLFVSGPETSLARAFGTSFGVYEKGSQSFVAPIAAPHFARSLPVTGITRLITMQREFRTLVPIGGNAISRNGYLPQQIRNAFDYTGAYAAGYAGKGITVGIVGTGPISHADVPAYGAMFDTHVARVVQRDVTDSAIASVGIENPPDTGFAAPPHVTAPCQDALPACNPEDIEAQVDTETVASLAPDALVAFYLGYNPTFCETSSGTIVAGPCGHSEQPLLGLPLADDEIQQAIADNAVDVLSLSYGGPEGANAGFEFDSSDPTQGIGPEEFAALAVEGVAVFVSSGDSGAEGCQRPAFGNVNDACVSYPATDPSVTSVGGVTAPLDNFGNLTNQIIGWGLTTGQGAGGSGGGISAYFPHALTPWQAGPHITGQFRNQPDLSLLGDPETGMATLIYANLGGPVVGEVGGTSVAAPEMAAMWSLVLQACKRAPSCAKAQGGKPYRLGNAAPLLYALYSNGTHLQPTYHQTFYDVVYGNNQQTGPGGLDPGYNAGHGYDLVTGLGVPFARALIKAVTQQ
jgi:kumamolisin